MYIFINLKPIGPKTAIMLVQAIQDKFSISFKILLLREAAKNMQMAPPPHFQVRQTIPPRLQNFIQGQVWGR